MSARAVRIEMVRDELRAGRLKNTREDVTRYVDEILPTVPEEERKRIANGALASFLPTRPTERPRPMTEPEVLRGDALTEAAAALWRKDSNQTTKEVYGELKKSHKLAVTEASFANMHAPSARRLAGASGKRVSGKKPAAKKKPQASRARTSSGPTKAGGKRTAPEPPAVQRTEEKDGNEASARATVRLEAGSAVLHAELDDSGWRVLSFQGAVEGSDLNRLLDITREAMRVEDR